MEWTVKPLTSQREDRLVALLKDAIEETSSVCTGDDMEATAMHLVSLIDEVTLCELLAILTDTHVDTIERSFSLIGALRVIVQFLTTYKYHRLIDKAGRVYVTQKFNLPDNLPVH